MHHDAKAYLEQISDVRFRDKLKTFFDAYDAMDRENTHLRLMLQDGKGCLYGHFSAAGCELGYPGCACMDDMLAMQSWSPEDEGKAVVRIGMMFNQARKLIADLQLALVDAAEREERAGGDPVIAQAFRRLSSARIMDRRHDL